VKYLIGAFAAVTIALVPMRASAETPFGFFFQAFNPSNVLAPAPPSGQRIYAPTAYQRQLPPFPEPSARAYAPPPAPGFWGNQWRQRFAAVPPQEPAGEAALASDLRRQLVAVNFNQNAGTIIIDTQNKFLYLMQEDGRAMRYGIGVGREGFEWSGTAKVGRKAEWPTWTPPKEMRQREPWLPESMDGGLENPLGARALYLFEGAKDTLYRIHGTNQPETIGKAVSSGCIRMLNEDVIDLYQRVPIGTKVVVI